VVIFYLYVFALGRTWNLIIVALFCVLHFVPIKWIVASHTRRQRPWNVAATVGAAATAIAIIVLLPVPPRWLVLTSGAFCLYLIAASVVHTFLPEDTLLAGETHA